ncbi:hydrogenase maturation nickel metallochaperone HypA [Frankia sp. CNm7]|uniref:Hydrogenase maturation factor HypA n=1 Tax=Frankia nepalensis TaxID=1836974 RepID=A0A937RD96_9ACTN|nr:hydrogenase maturation nickel metallochaperone HypA [Frankia nepalensis]MBL7495884.1 hydrogenase maturation nickel metallochaperone HypA [Frankia nepalensis]MBL7510389.1 hydrogenase maturation nickel metallochaperone HypA [Frankia nepalensis]MBL7518633.1 hydrogenase maturation nickel metallochaperone HypA [Frankia nepalensis]MBL7629988.1 hydrogenase maturation nickel metallochaperone HypA [Frankia nepalensis]
MHELAVTQGIVEMIVDRVRDRRVLAVNLAIGQISGVAPHAIRFCFDLVAAGTVVEGARLHIDTPIGRARCRSCGLDDLVVEAPIPLCGCGSADLEVTSGDELVVTSVEVAV